MTPDPRLPEGCISVRETAWPALLALGHPGWRERFPWLAQGITTRGAAGAAGAGGEAGAPDFDLRLFGSQPLPAGVLGRWDALRDGTSMPAAVHARQVHGATVRIHGPAAPGLRIAPDCDGHLTDAPGLLLAVAVADCVPVFVVDTGRREVALLHAGWRGVAAGILERGLEALADRGSRPASLHVHLGPSICGACYEVGPEVFEAVGLPRPEGPTPIDLRAVLARRAVAGGVPGGSISISGHCTRCGSAGLFSHRGGDAGRQVAFLGIRP